MMHGNSNIKCYSTVVDIPHIYNCMLLTFLTRYAYDSKAKVAKKWSTEIQVFNKTMSNILYIRHSYKDFHVASFYIKPYFLLIRFSVSAVLFYQYFMQLLSLCLSHTRARARTHTHIHTHTHTHLPNTGP